MKKFFKNPITYIFKNILGEFIDNLVVEDSVLALLWLRFSP